ncbi:complement C3-like protein [Labeo rohita]|uniref:Complement C3-like protein n=1 Tax=Labeo rohita TaxID=84645 RepID=A0A498LKI1_LABRO|nr:complement C3-like protein [Labeo rohita]
MAFKWLTAYVAKVFAMASDLINVDDNVICSALKWLNLHKQLPNGSFKEDTAVEMQLHREMVRDNYGEDADASLTAFVLIAMQESREICAGSVGLDLLCRGGLQTCPGRLLRTRLKFSDLSALLWWLSAPLWGALNLSAQLWCSSAMPWYSSVPPTPRWWSSALHWWASALLLRSSVPLWWSSAPSWLSAPLAPPWLVAPPAPPWLSAPLALPQFLVPPLLHGPGPLSLPVVCPKSGPWMNFNTQLA